MTFYKDSFIQNISYASELSRSTELAKSLIVSIGLFSFKYNQFNCYEQIYSNQERLRFRLNFSHDIYALYIFTLQNSNIYEEKWFDICIINVDGYNTISFNYETLIYYNQNNNLPKGIISIPNVNQVPFHSSRIHILFDGASFQSNKLVQTKLEEIEFNFCCSAESLNYIITDYPNSVILFDY